MKKIVLTSEIFKIEYDQIVFENSMRGISKKRSHEMCIVNNFNNAMNEGFTVDEFFKLFSVRIKNKNDERGDIMQINYYKLT